MRKSVSERPKMDHPSAFLNPAFRSRRDDIATESVEVLSGTVTQNFTLIGGAATELFVSGKNRNAQQI